MNATQNRPTESRSSTRKLGTSSQRRSAEATRSQTQKAGFEADERRTSTNVRGYEGASQPQMRYQGGAVYPQIPAAYPQQGVLFPFWVPPYMLAQGFAHPAFWQPPAPGSGSWYVQCGSAAPQQDQGMTGTGVFLPASAVCCEESAAEQTCAESDGDSAESASDCIMLEETAPIRRGQIESTTSIELLLPKEWEY